MRALTLLTLLCACGQIAGTAGEDTLTTISKRKAIIVGIELGFEPFEGVNPDGEYVGFDIDLARAYAKELGVECRFETMEWTALQTALGTGQIDLIWSGMTATLPRSVSILFSDTYFRTRLYLLVPSDSDIRKAADVSGKKISVKTGTTGVAAAQLLFPDCELVQFDDESLCATEVLTGRADAFLYDRFSIERHFKAAKGRARVVKDVESFEPYSVAMRPGDHALARSINLVLERARWDGRYAAIHQKHFGTAPNDGR